MGLWILSRLPQTIIWLLLRYLRINEYFIRIINMFSSEFSSYSILSKDFIIFLSASDLTGMIILSTEIEVSKIFSSQGSFNLILFMAYRREFMGTLRMIFLGSIIDLSSWMENFILFSLMVNEEGRKNQVSISIIRSSEVRLSRGINYLLNIKSTFIIKF